MIWGNETHVLREGIDQVMQFGGLRLTRSQIIAGIVRFSLLWRVNVNCALGCVCAE